MIKVDYKPDILECLANLSNDEVFTPPNLANDLIDILPQEIFRNPNAKFLDPCCKSGVFLREIAKRLNEGLKEVIPDTQERVNHIMTQQLYGIAITSITSIVSRRTLYCSKRANGNRSIVTNFKNREGNIFFNSRQNHTYKNGKCIYCGAPKSKYDSKVVDTHAYEFIHNLNRKEILNMKFDVIIGNPPYQLDDGGNGASAVPIYDKFVEQAKKLQPRYLVMIIPARWYSGGRNLNHFRNDMINDKHIRELHDFSDSSICFEGVEIKGGVCFFLWDRENQGKCKVVNQDGSTELRYLNTNNSNIFIRYNGVESILKKVESKNSISEKMSSQRPFGFRTFYKGESKRRNNKYNIRVYCNHSIGYTSIDKISKNIDLVDKYKVILPRAIGSGIAKTDILKSIISEPGSCCSETYIVARVCNSEQEAKNFITYINTKFFHFLLTLRKNTMMAPKEVYNFIPEINFENSWTDEKLFDKYNLTQDERDYIISMVNPKVGEKIE